MIEAAAPSTGDLRRWLAALGELAPAVDDADRIERLRLLEELKSAAAAAQSVEAVAFARSQRSDQARLGVAARQQGRGIAAQIGLARRISPWLAQRWLGWSTVLTSELPATLAELRAGRTTEHRAMLVARETLWLSREDRLAVDTELGPKLSGWGDRRVEAEARRAAYRLDPAGAVDRSRQAETDRHVSLRPAPDVMCRLTALLPLAQGVAAYAALCRTADTTTAAGDHRGRGQIMADTLIERVTGQHHADATPAEIVLVISDATLLGHNTDTLEPASSAAPRAGTAAGDVAVAGGDANEPALLLGPDGVGCFPIPAPIARHLAYRVADDIPRWIRRLYSHQGRLVSMESDRREFTGPHRRFLRLRDHTCRTPYCDAPIRHADHVEAHATGGPTHTYNGQGACVCCNHAKQAPGWHARPHDDGTITTRTPTGHHYTSHHPAPPRPAAPPAAPPPTAPPPKSALERELRTLLDNHLAKV